MSATFLLAAGSRLPAAETSRTTPPPPVVWKLEGLHEIGGHQPTVEGAPGIGRGPRGEAALEFNGRNDGVVLPVNPLAGKPHFTIEVLFKPAPGGETEQRFFHVQDEAGRRALLEIRLNREGGWWLDTFLRAGDASLALIDPRKVHPADRWHWVALRYDGKQMAGFVNGEKETQGTVAFGAMGPGEVALGVRLNRIYWFKGAIREVRFHASAIEPSALQRVRD
jgi:Concanavalin A-like lectin/glucanases superfamily